MVQIEEYMVAFINYDNGDRVSLAEMCSTVAEISANEYVDQFVGGGNHGIVIHEAVDVTSVPEGVADADPEDDMNITAIQSDKVKDDVTAAPKADPAYSAGNGIYKFFNEEHGSVTPALFRDYDRHNMTNIRPTNS